MYGRDAARSRRRSPLPLAALAIVWMLPLAATITHAQCQTTMTCWPPAGTCAFFAPGPISFPSLATTEVHTITSPSVATIGLRTIYIDGPSACVPLPLAGGTFVDSFFDIDFTLQLSNYGETMWLPPSAGTAPCLVRLQPPVPVGGELFFETEMLQLDITGGSLPPGHRIRESPSRPSLGGTGLEDLGGGLYRIDSFFDVFVELSVDDGQTWLVSGQPLHFTTVDRMVQTRAGTWGAVKVHYR